MFHDVLFELCLGLIEREEPCLLLVRHKLPAMDEILAEWSIDIVGCILRLESNANWRVCIIAIIRLATLAGQIGTVADAGPIVIVALRVDPRTLHLATNTMTSSPEIIVVRTSGREEDIGEGPLRIILWQVARAHVPANQPTGTEQFASAGVLLAQLILEAVLQCSIAHLDSCQCLTEERCRLHIYIIALVLLIISFVYQLVVFPEG